MMQYKYLRNYDCAAIVMIQQFKKTTLLKTLLGLCSLSTPPFVLAQEDSTQTRSSKITPANSELGQAFYRNYYLTPQQLATSPRREDTQISPLCSGTWVAPVGMHQNIASDPAQTTSVVSADRAYYDPNGVSFLEGDVNIDQEGRLIRADKLELDSTQTFAKLEGHVQMAQSGLFVQSDQINYNIRTQTGDLNNSFYISEQQQAHGYANSIKRTAPDVVVLENASYSGCAPSTAPHWHFQAKSIELNQSTGRGVTKDATLYIKNVPVLPIPYFNFPIDDRRTTGFLTPSFGYTNDGGLQLSVPYYFNLAPNYDLTLTPRYLGNRGAMMEANVNYLTDRFGEGQIWGSYLPQDQDYSDEDRKDLHWQHAWKINDQFKTRIDYNYVSDKDFFTDLSNVPTSQDLVNQERTWVLDYANGIPGITAQLRVQDFQTLDKTLADIDRPYARLPQFLFQYQGGQFNGLEYNFLNDSAYFKKSIRDGSGIESSGTRLYNQATVRYNYRTPGFFILPELSVRSINTFFDKDTKISNGIDENESFERSVAIPQITLDAGMTFEKEGQYLHTLSPRLFYAYSPYKDQSNYPNFDSAAATISYDQLFSPYRFYGHDRLEDNHFTSLGVTYRLYDKIGLERLKASIGQTFYLADRKVRLTPQDPMGKDKNSGPILSVSSQLSNTITISGNSAWSAKGKNDLNNLTANYADDTGRSYNVGYFYRRAVQDQNQQSYQQVAASFIQPITQNWRILGHTQYDFKDNLSREWLLGLNYESCCWGVSVYGRSYYNDLDDPKDAAVSAKRAVMAEFSLKGLGGISNRLSSLLQDRVIGFNDVNQTWTER